MNGRTMAIAATLALVSIGLVAAVWNWRGDASAGLLRPDDRQIVGAGLAIYQEHCGVCHGDKLEGEPDWRNRKPDGLLPAPPHDETGHTWHHPDQVLFDITKLGIGRAANLTDYESAMPPYEGVLSDAEIIAVLSYIKSTWPAPIRQRHDQLNQMHSMEPRS